MRILIIGGGFYGFHIAKTLFEFNNNFKIDIFEKENLPFTGAFTNNQHRLHLGFHYPRSFETISQAKNNYNSFFKKYSPWVRIPENNIYAIHKDSLVSEMDYFNTYSDADIFIEQISEDIFEHTNLDFTNIKALFKTKEGTVDFFGISKYLTDWAKNKVNFYPNKEIRDLPKNYDITINATYNNPNMFLNEKIPLKHELCAILIAKNILDNNLGFTVMDGEFCSIFPMKEGGLHSVSSVTHTPYFKTNENSFSRKQIQEIYNDLNVKDKIYEHSTEFLKYNKENITSEMLSIKTKFLQDVGDTREAILKKEGNHYSIFCGKISAICEIAEQIKNDIRSL